MYIYYMMIINELLYFRGPPAEIPTACHKFVLFVSQTTFFHEMY